MYRLLSSPPFPAMVLALGCATGFMASRYAPEDAITRAAAPTAALAQTAPGGTFDRVVADVESLPSEAGEVAEGAQDTPGVFQANRASDGLFYVSAKVNGQAVRFLIDTGASITMLRAADARQLGLTPTADRFGERVQTVGGSTNMAWTHLETVRIAGRDIHGVRAGIVRQGLAVSLLGQNMLQRLGSVKIEGDRMELR